MRIPRSLVNADVVWLSVTDAADFYGKCPRTIRLWCYDGTLVSAKCRVRRDLKGQWIIGVPANQMPEMSAI